mmetsp:Transcript_1465/g.2670  ORF Transcript_1465/g.2670 Transcript_1465/m.2670 type:complete len:129 (+) Transcript_1465:234-620(+)
MQAHGGGIWVFLHNINVGMKDDTGHVPPQNTHTHTHTPTDRLTDEQMRQTNNDGCTTRMPERLIAKTITICSPYTALEDDPDIKQGKHGWQQWSPSHAYHKSLADVQRSQIPSSCLAPILHGQTSQTV